MAGVIDLPYTFISPAIHKQASQTFAVKKVSK